MDIHPAVALMRRYCIDYTNVHDLSVCDSLMREDYTVTVSGRTLPMSDYRGAVEGAFARFPTLGLTVHDMILSGDRLAMRFSEHGASSRHDGRVAVWRGISLYRFDGDRLRTCDVEQDFLGRDRQLTEGYVAPLEVEATDPWSQTAPAPTNTDAEATVRQWFDAWARRSDRAHLQAAGFRLVVDASDLDGPDELTFDDAQIEVTDVFSAGPAVAARAVLHGTYAGGLSDVAETSLGRSCDLPITALARMHPGGRLAEMRIIRDRWGLQRRLR